MIKIANVIYEEKTENEENKSYNSPDKLNENEVLFSHIFYLKLYKIKHLHIYSYILTYQFYIQNNQVHLLI